MAERVTLSLRAKDDGATRTLRSVQGALKNVSSSARELDRRIETGVTTAFRRLDRHVVSATSSTTQYAGALRGLVGIYAASRLIDGMESAVKASIDQETIFKRLEFQLGQIGVAYKDVEADIQSFAARQQETTRFGDTDTAQSLQRLVAITGTYDNALRGVAIAQGLAETTGRGLNESTNVVGKALAGNLEALGEFLPEARELARSFDKNATMAEKGAAALDLLERKFGTSAQAISEADLNLARISNNFGDLSEAIGDATRESEYFRAGLATLNGWIVESIKNIGLLAGAAGEVGPTFSSNLDRFTDSLRTNGLAAADNNAEFRRLNDEWADSVNQLAAFEQAGLGMTQQALSLKSNIAELEKLLHPYETAIKRVRKELKAKGEAAAEAARKAKAAAAGTKEAIDILSVIDQDFGGRAGKSLGKIGADAAIQGAVDFDAPSYLKVLEQKKAALEFALSEEQRLREEYATETARRELEIAVRAEEQRLQFGQTVQGAINSFQIQSIDMLSKSLTHLALTGEFSAKSLAANFVGAIGQMSTSIGTFLLLSGKGVLSLSTLSGGGAIAAGAALIAFGGVLSAASSALQEGGRDRQRGGVASAPDFGPSGPPRGFVQNEPQETVIRIEVSGGGSGNDVEDANATLAAAGLHRLIDQGRVRAGVMA